MIKMELGMCSCFYNKLFWGVDLGKQEQRIHEKYTRHECELNKDLAGCANTNNKA